MNVRQYVAEVIGTYILVVIGSLAIFSTGGIAGSPLLVVVPLGFGLGLLAAIYAVGHISGGHFNPAVTLGALLDGRIGLPDAVGYAIAQIIGAVGASLTVLVISSADVVSSTRNAPGISDLGAFVVEVVLTAVFLLVILTVTKRRVDLAPVAISLALVVIHVAGIPLSGASVNPARSLGPAIVAMDFSSLWIYLTAPFVGAAIGWGIYRALGEGVEA